MSERFNSALKILCLGLAAFLVYQIASLIARKDPLKQLEFTTLVLGPASETPVKEMATNALPQKATAERKTNSVSRQVSAKPRANLPPAVQSRIDRITSSEILGAVIRPLPMALLGIAGKDVFLRAPDGQTGLLREGDELGGVKLLRVGTNRVLIEHEQQQKELTVFSGFG